MILNGQTKNMSRGNSGSRTCRSTLCERPGEFARRLSDARDRNTASDSITSVASSIFSPHRKPGSQYQDQSRNEIPPLPSHPRRYGHRHLPSKVVPGFSPLFTLSPDTPRFSRCRHSFMRTRLLCRRVRESIWGGSCGGHAGRQKWLISLCLPYIARGNGC